MDVLKNGCMKCSILTEVLVAKNQAEIKFVHNLERKYLPSTSQVLPDPC